MTRRTLFYFSLDLDNEELIEAIGKLNYNFYCKSTGGVSLISGDKLPEFEDLKPKIQQAWKDAAKGLLAHYGEDI